MIFIMVLAGCISQSNDETKDESESLPVMILNAAWIDSPDLVIVGDVATFSASISSNLPESWMSEIEISNPDGNKFDDYTWSVDSSSISLSFIPTDIGIYFIEIKFMSKITGNEFNIESGNLSHLINVEAPLEFPPIIGAPSGIIVENPDSIILQGTIQHANISTCSLDYGTLENPYSISIQENGNWNFVIDSSLSRQNYLILTATCGEWELSTVNQNVTLIYANDIIDSDNDGIEDSIDSCTDGTENSWKSNLNTDYDSDGCRDISEDLDDDNDGIDDYLDTCFSTLGWTSEISTDYDSDGCHDSLEDDDDDNDGINDLNDLCPLGSVGLKSNDYTDWDKDGCIDLIEDDNDDQDDYLDLNDSCPLGETYWMANESTDFDGDGCQDFFEDDDDDNDGVNDFNSTGGELDLCPRTPLGSIDINENGCAAIERDGDNDGINDLDDQCEGTPVGIIVNQVGCADVDGDGVFSNVDLCPSTPQRWTVDSFGCTVAQLPVPWTNTNTLNGPMQIVPDFTIPTLSSTFYFDDSWTGEDVYLFLFKYTSSTGSSNLDVWGQNPGTLIRNLPSNVHLFYGSFDSSYYNDITERKTAVENSLNPSEEDDWNGRIHYINLRASSISGGLGDMISNINNPLYMGIDRFQMARETGSLASHPSGNTDPLHLAYEPIQWNAEFPTEIRLQDPGIEIINMMDFEYHQGGWGGGYNSKRNVSFPSNLSSYDTLEIYHEHACDERSNRHQKSDGTEGGCHEWDFESNLYICDRVEYNSCGTEYLRWITTYGREGRWLTDATPYLFMLEDNDNRQFRYGGANRGSLTISFLLSNWGESDIAHSGEFAFSGGQFDGTYNDESINDRQFNFTVPNGTARVEIVATITGHGFGQDNENCAEFCNHEHHYSLNGYHAAEYHPIANSIDGCKQLVDQGVVANQYGTWPYGRAGWCPGQDVKQWRYDITSWSDMTGISINNLQYQGLFNGQEYSPSDGEGNGNRNIHAEIWIVYYQ